MEIYRTPSMPAKIIQPLGVQTYAIRKLRLARVPSRQEINLKTEQTPITAFPYIGDIDKEIHCPSMCKKKEKERPKYRCSKLQCIIYSLQPRGVPPSGLDGPISMQPKSPQTNIPDVDGGVRRTLNATN
ncbi:uncharacterized protein APUU_21830S [Aspergillus puulaauensis]|uniref:Uncharacterized protein n=1 Tax=Aspergillus puulaauensis TaxID=1220207 RepID=A0A7R7XH13_9EURO|nr:uncharacterized protein APUU_21830S [Aspergillus puulaauensis]BCS21397.1 hypothetical protein APUU_21830S [Aspergillus puulaauensis]